MSVAANQPPAGFRMRGAAPQGTRIVFIRHGEAFCNARGVVGGPLGCGGLTPRGQAQARSLRDRLERTRELSDVSALYASVLPRAIETAQILRPALAELPLSQDCRLCELHPGEADGLTWSAMAERFGSPDWDLDPAAPYSPGGESWLDFYARCEGVLEELVARHSGQRIVLVVHGGVIEQAMKIQARERASARLQLLTENCSMTEIEFDGDRRRLLRYNDLAPLAAE